MTGDDIPRVLSENNGCTTRQLLFKEYDKQTFQIHQEYNLAVTPCPEFCRHEADIVCPYGYS